MMKSTFKKYLLTLGILNLAPLINAESLHNELPSIIPNQTVLAQSVSAKAHAQTVIDDLAAMYPTDTLPTYVLTPELPLYVTAATTPTKDQDNYNILYYAENSPIQINDSAVNELTPIASFNKSTYASEAEAIEAVHQIIDLQGQEVDLGYGITGYMQGAAGSSYLNWTEGNWSLIVQASNIEEENPIPLAQEIVKYLEDVYLPAPSNAGQITLKSSPAETYEANTVIWQEDNIVYKVHHKDPKYAIIMTGSISNPTEQ